MKQDITNETTAPAPAGREIKLLERNKLIYFTYTLLALISVPITVLALLLAPILPSQAIYRLGYLNNGSVLGWGYYMPSCLSWFGTFDNDLTGDDGWKKEHWQWRYKLPLPLSDYVGMVGWLWRNPAYGYAVRHLDGTTPATWSGDKTIRDNDNARAGWCFVKAGGLFQWTWIKPIGFKRCVRITLGWNIAALVDDNVQPKPNPYEATFVFSPRLSGFR